MTGKRIGTCGGKEGVRFAGNQNDGGYHMGRMKEALLKEGHKFSVFGGEPLLIPIDDLEELFAWGQQQFAEKAAKYGQSANGIQTDGYLITDAHVRMFKRYGVGVGVSCDGPEELNDSRVMRKGGIEETRKATRLTLAAIDKMLKYGVKPSLIITLHRGNADAERLPRLLNWLTTLAAKGAVNVNLHLLEVDDPSARSLALSEDDAVEALLACARLMSSTGLKIEPLTDMLSMLRGVDQWNKRDEDGGYSAGVSCTWNGCDPYTTDAVRGVDGQGNRRNCGRTYKHGVQYPKAERAGFERYLALYYTPQDYGGCQGCRFFYACKGHCPGEGEHNDWRGKTEHCAVLMRVFGALEAGLVAKGEEPLSLSGERPALEAAMLEQWSAGQQALITRTLEWLKEGEPVVRETAVNRDHGDVPHGDEHGDSDDPEWVAAHPDWQRPVEEGVWRKL
jgi:uncharacterized protein